MYSCNFEPLLDRLLLQRLLDEASSSPETDFLTRKLTWFKMKLFPCRARPHTETTPNGPFTICNAATASGSILNLPLSSQYTSRNGRAEPAVVLLDLVLVVVLGVVYCGGCGGGAVVLWLSTGGASGSGFFGGVRYPKICIIFVARQKPLFKRKTSWLTVWLPPSCPWQDTDSHALSSFLTGTVRCYCTLLFLSPYHKHMPIRKMKKEKSEQQKTNAKRRNEYVKRAQILPRSGQNAAVATAAWANPGERESRKRSEEEREKERGKGGRIRSFDVVREKHIPFEC